MSSSSDDIPIEDIAARARAAPSPARSESPVPDWISQYHSPAAAKPSPQRFSVDSDDLEIIGSKPANASQEAVAEAHAAEPAQASQKASPKAKLTSAKAGRSKQKAAVPTVAMTLQKSGVQSTAAAAAPDSAALQNTTDAGAVQPGEIPVMLPDKLPTNKYVVELEPAGDGADDLTGDAGAVGRMIVSGDGPDAELRLDLKGVIYSAVLVPSACSLAVVNISGTEARVETLTSSFMQLTREAGPSGETDDAANHFLWDDDDNYQLGAEGDDQAPKKKLGKRKGGGEGGDADLPVKKRKQGAKTSKAQVRRKPTKGTKAKPKKKPGK